MRFVLRPVSGKNARTTSTKLPDDLCLPSVSDWTIQFVRYDQRPSHIFASSLWRKKQEFGGSKKLQCPLLAITLFQLFVNNPCGTKSKDGFIIAPGEGAGISILESLSLNAGKA